MKISFIKLRVLLFLAGLVLLATLFLSRFLFTKTNISLSYQDLEKNVPPENVEVTNFSGLAKEIFQKVELERKKYNLKGLVWDEKVSKMALAHSKKMADEGFFSHYDKQGKSVSDRAKNFNVKWRRIGENLFMTEGYTKPSDVAVKGWLKSPGHRKNMLGKDWTHTGVGVYTAKNGKTYITQVFITK